jgi:uncharacterized protein YacL (UPF0231 family)
MIGRLGEQANSKKEDKEEDDFSLHDQESITKKGIFDFCHQGTKTQSHFLLSGGFH